MVLTFKSADKILKCGPQMNATKQDFHSVLLILFIMLFKAVLTSESVGETVTVSIMKAAERHFMLSIRWFYFILFFLFCFVLFCFILVFFF